jgi:hypothetical protein
MAGCAHGGRWSLYERKLLIGPMACDVMLWEVPDWKGPSNFHRFPEEPRLFMSNVSSRASLIWTWSKNDPINFLQDSNPYPFQKSSNLSLQGDSLVNDCGAHRNHLKCNEIATGARTGVAVIWSLFIQSHASGQVRDDFRQREETTNQNAPYIKKFDT